MLCSCNHDFLFFLYALQLSAALLHLRGNNILLRVIKLQTYDHFIVSVYARIDNR